MFSLTEMQWKADDLVTDDDFSIAVTDRLSKKLKGLPSDAFIYLALSLTTLYRWLPGEALSSYSPNEIEEARRRAHVLEDYVHSLVEEFTPEHLERVRQLLKRIIDDGIDSVEDDPDWRNIDWQTLYAIMVAAPLSRSEVLERSDRLCYTVLILVAVTKWAFTADIFKDLRAITTFISEYRILFVRECERDQEVSRRASQRGMLGLRPSIRRSPEGGGLQCGPDVPESYRGVPKKPTREIPSICTGAVPAHLGDKYRTAPVRLEYSRGANRPEAPLEFLKILAYQRSRPPPPPPPPPPLRGSCGLASLTVRLRPSRSVPLSLSIACWASS